MTDYRDKLRQHLADNNLKVGHLLGALIPDTPPAHRRGPLPRPIATAESPEGELVTQSEMARRFGVSPSRITQLRRDPSFPREVEGVSGSVLFLWSEVRDWRRAQGAGGA